MVWPFSRTKQKDEPWRKEAADSDFGRRYGWTIEIAGREIGSLSYIRWNEDAQFWHEYDLTVHDLDWMILKSDANAWIANGIVLRSNRFPDFLQSQVLAAPRPNGTVAIRFAWVPEERFRNS